MAPVKAQPYPGNGQGGQPEVNLSPGPFGEIGRTGLRNFYGRIDEEPLVELKWENGQKIYREMSENDSTVGAMLNGITLMIRQARSNFETDNQGDPRVQFLEECRDDMEHSWTDLLAEIGRGTLVYGWQVHECVYKMRDGTNSQYDDGLIGWKKLAVRAQDTLYRWDYDLATQDLKAFIQRPPPDYKERRIPMEKIALFRTEMFKDNPEGRSILRNAYRPWYFKKNIENMEGIGVERDLAGFPVIYVAPKILGDPTLKAEYETMVTAIKRDEQEGVVLPAMWDEHGNRLCELTLLSAPGQRQFDTTAIINRYDLRILQLMLADFIQIGHDSVGSKALASTKTNLFLMANTVLLHQIASVFNRQLIPRLLELNGMDVHDSPQLQFAELEQRDLTALGDYVTKLSAAGMPLFPNPKMEAALLNFADLPVPTPEEMQVRDDQIAADQHAQLLAQAQATAQGAKDQAGQAQQQADKTAQQVKALLERPIEKTQPQPIALTINGAPTTVTSGMPGAQTFNVMLPETKPSQVVMQQPITVAPSPAPPPANIALTVEAAKAAEVHTHTTIQAPPATVIPAPQVTTVVEQAKVDVTVEAPDPAVVNIAPAQVTVMNQIEKQDPPIVNLTLDAQPVADAITAAAEKLKRPSKLTITNPDGTVTEATPTDEPT